MDELNPATLEGDEFHDWISSHLAYRHDWSHLLVSEHISRTRDSVDGLLSLLQDQLSETDRSADWRKRTMGMKSMADQRLRQIDRHIEGAGKARLMSAWKAFADQLVCLIIENGSDEMVDMLEDVMIPVGGLNAGQWHDRRADKRAAA